jgi:hypothetical protein
MKSAAARFVLRFFVLGWLAGSLLAQNRPAGPGLVAHEWGTFTSLAGKDGQAVQWTPLDFNDLRRDQNGSIQWSDGHFHSRELPSFVETVHFGLFKAGLAAKIRMETPVLYFYSPRPLTLSVQVKFLKGLITEWYPHASMPVRDDGSDSAKLYQERSADGGISWDNVTLQPGANPGFPRELDDSGNRYYAARETVATPLSVHAAGADQQEKFLFYRGVSMNGVPLSATFTGIGNLRVANSLDDEIPRIIWYERRGEQAGYRISNGLSGAGEVVLDPPELTGAVDSLAGDLEEILVTQGLYRDEAHAMIETWRDHWFEEGSRLFYIVPQHFVDTILPLKITPAPAQTVRVFVGRLELVAPATKQAVAAAMANHDEKALAKYGRFLGPIMEMIRKEKRQPSQSSLTTAPCPVQSPVAASPRR